MFLYYILPYALILLLWFVYEIFKSPKILKNEAGLSGKDYNSRGDGKSGR